MIYLNCGECGSEKLMKDGKSESGKQRYRCRSCGKGSRENARRPGVSAEIQSAVFAALGERMSLRAAARTFRMSRNTITALLEKKTL